MLWCRERHLRLVIPPREVAHGSCSVEAGACWGHRIRHSMVGYRLGGWPRMDLEWRCGRDTIRRDLATRRHDPQASTRLMRDAGTAAAPSAPGRSPSKQCDSAANMPVPSCAAMGGPARSSIATSLGRSVTAHARLAPVPRLGFDHRLARAHRRRRHHARRALWSLIERHPGRSVGRGEVQSASFLTPNQIGFLLPPAAHRVPDHEVLAAGGVPGGRYRTPSEQSRGMNMPSSRD